MLAISAGCTRSDRPDAEAAEAADTPIDTGGFRTALDGMLAAHRQLIVLFADETSLSAADRTTANNVGHTIYHDNLNRTQDLVQALSALVTAKHPRRLQVIEAMLDFIESDPALFDADRLAFRELLRDIAEFVASDGTLPAIKVHKRIADDLDALASIEDSYQQELRTIFGRFDTRSIQPKRERWSDYLAKLQAIYTRESILKQYAVVVPYPEQPPSRQGEERELFGINFPAKTVALTFDDGPHQRYTDEIAAILKQYNAPAVFFQVGRNIGTVDETAKVTPGARAKITRELLDGGFVVGNHSFSHAELSRQKEEVLRREIAGTDDLLKSVDPRRSALFRFPYGANSDAALKLVAARQLQSVNWNIDSLDWADPVPDSIVDRVMRIVGEEKRGIILFHDIHEATVKALPKILNRLTAEGYRFAGWDGKAFVAPEPTDEEQQRFSISSDYGESWAVIIGIDDYAHWPKLQYAVRDAEAVRDELVEHFGFSPDRVFTLRNAEATRDAIYNLFHDKFSQNRTGKDDRLFVFFAGHGATQRLSSGRDLGYLIPADARPDALASDGIPMTDIQNISESISPKHVLFVMDACYSGLGLTRGSAMRFLRDNARRQGRQMLTAGGADQEVADGGPNGHSVFTWTLLQALAGKGDLNGDGLMTATELAAYVGPAVAGIARQTPAFGSLPGAQGGEFVLERRAEIEFLNAGTSQLTADAVRISQKLDAAAPDTGSRITIRDLQGKDREVKLPKAVNSTQRQLAQRANDLGLQLYRELRYDEAEEKFTEALRLRPDFALAANNLGFIFFKREQYDAAVRWYEKTISIDPSRAVAYLNLGDAYGKLGDDRKARKAYLTYLELAPTGREAERVRGLVE